MRELKFRVWDKDKKEYIYQTMLDLRNGIGDDCADWETFMFSSLIADGAVEEQFTGLQDKNGVDSYSGDKICYENDYPCDMETGKTSADTNNDIGVIYWNDEMACFSVKSSVGAREHIDMPLWQFMDEYGDYKIIGHIHESPDKPSHVPVSGR